MSEELREAELRLYRILRQLAEAQGVVEYVRKLINETRIVIQETVDAIHEIERKLVRG